MQSSSNPFRANWLYRRLPAGDAMLGAEKGISPAFAKLLAAVDSDRAISFSALEARFSHLDADDLELWLAELCRMQLIVPAQAADEVALPGLPELAEAAASNQADDPFGAIEAAPAETELATQPAATRPDLLLVHKLPSTRLAWRDLLSHLPVQMHEAGSLEEAGEAYNRLQPAGVVIGPEGSDFNALNLIHVLKHPRAPRLTKVILVLDERSFSKKVKNAAASADDTVAPEAWESLAERVARHLSLPKSVQYAAAPLRLMEEGQMSCTDLRAGLEFEHPRVAALIADRWGKGSLDDLFDQLIFDTGGKEHEFSPQAMEDLLFLYRMHRDLRPQDAWRTEQVRARRARVAALRATARLRTLSQTGRHRVLN
jgi:DNA-binding response OmpR family regulator